MLEKFGFFAAFTIALILVAVYIRVIMEIAYFIGSGIKKNIFKCIKCFFHK
ncbi:MAG: hypothetical protein WC677_07920 [Clostridia bacterium]|jgi:hypothetical protein